MKDTGKGLAFGCGLVPGIILGCALIALVGVLGCLLVLGRIFSAGSAAQEVAAGLPPRVQTDVTVQRTATHRHPGRLVCEVVITNRGALTFQPRRFGVRLTNGSGTEATYTDAGATLACCRAVKIESPLLPGQSAPARIEFPVVGDEDAAEMVVYEN